MEQLELVSVIMSTYNETEKELRQSVDSILNQTWRNIEFIVINDNPNNKLLLRILNEYEKKDKRMRIYQNPTNIGLARSMNNAIQYANGQYIARMDADDISMPERIEHEMEYLKKFSLDMVSTNRIKISELGEELEKVGRLPMRRSAEKLLPYGDPIIHPSVLIRKNVLVDLGGYRNFASAQDYDLWLRMLTAGYKIGILDESLLCYRIRKAGISRSNHYKQFLFTKYARNLYKERKRYGNNDSFSEKNMEKFIKKRYTETKKRKFDKAYSIFEIGVDNLINDRFWNGVKYIFKSIMLDKNCANNIFCVLRFKLKKAMLLKTEEKYRKESV